MLYVKELILYVIEKYDAYLFEYISNEWMSNIKNGAVSSTFIKPGNIVDKTE